MLAKRLQELVDARPFRPLTIELINDRTVHVKHVDDIGIHKDGKTCYVEDDDGTTTVIDIRLIQYVVQLPLPEEDA